MNTFNESGVTNLKNELYGLPDEDLITEGKAMVAGFRDWLESKFDFTDGQMDYLDEIDPRVMTIWSAKLAAVAVARGPIELIFNFTPETYRTKQTDIESGGSTTHIPSGPPVISESAVISFEDT